MKRLILLFAFLTLLHLKGVSQDTSKPWFPGGDMAFYRYLEDRLQSLGIQSPLIEKNGESVVFEFYINDSGYVDSVRVLQCFNFELCYNIRQIMNTMPRANAEVRDGKTVVSRRVYALDFKYFRDGYQVEPSVMVPTSSYVSSKFKWGVVVIALVAMFVVIFK